MKKVSKPKVTGYKKGKVTVKWTNISGETGYQISRSKSSKKTSIVATVKSSTAKSARVSAKAKTKYYYKVRAYKTVNGKKIYGPWSSVKSYKLKK